MTFTVLKRVNNLTEIIPSEAEGLRCQNELSWVTGRLIM